MRGAGQAVQPRAVAVRQPRVERPRAEARLRTRLRRAEARRVGLPVQAEAARSLRAGQSEAEAGQPRVGVPERRRVVAARPWAERRATAPRPGERAERPPEGLEAQPLPEVGRPGRLPAEVRRELPGAAVVAA